MKKYLLLLFVLSGACYESNAQAELGDKEKMKAFSNWIGRWQGEGSMQMGPGEPRKSIVEETIEAKLDGMVLLIEGIGKAENPSTHEVTVVHHALAVLSYDKVTNQYNFRSYLKDGRSTDAWIKPIHENQFQWGFDIPGRGKMRYSITLDPAKKTWHETGEFSSDENTWSKFFEMNLKKVE